MILYSVPDAIKENTDIIEVTVAALKDPYINDLATFNQYDLTVDKVLKGNVSALKKGKSINLKVMDENIEAPMGTIQKGNKLLIGVYESKGSYLIEPCLAFYITDKNKVMNLTPCTEGLYNGTDLSYLEKLIKRANKNMRKRIYALIGLIGIVSFQSNNVSAHEIYYSEVLKRAVKLSFANYTSNGDLNVKVNGDSLSNDDYRNLLKTAASEWNGAKINYIIGTKIQVSYVSPWHANVTYCSSKSTWEYLDLTPTILGLTRPYNSAENKILSSYSSAVDSNGQINSATIYINPDCNIFKQNKGKTVTTKMYKDRIKKVITHELGHALGLGHPTYDYYNPISDSTYSIMRQGFPDITKTTLSLCNHDKTDIMVKFKDSVKFAMKK